ncbi:hypothetical protein QTP86_014353, partial [Hemibagrus guttatus]
MEASLSALKHESEVAAALAEAKVLEAAAESELGERISDVREISDHTRDCVMRQSQLELSPSVGDEPYQSPLEPIVHMLKPETPQRQHRFIAWDVRDSYNKPDTESIMQQPQRSVQTPSHKFQAPPFTSSPCKTTPQPSFNNDANVSEIAREARTRNDPSFALASGINSVLKLEQPVKRQVKSPVYAHKTEVSSVDNGRPSLLPPCPNKLSIKEKFDIKPLPEAPLPFRTPHQRLPNNRDQVLTRLSSLLRTLEKKSEIKSHFVTFMQNIFDRNHAEVAPPLREGQECWYLPIFGVYHPQKPGQIRVVFDSSAQKQGISLNDVLLSGPDLNNSFLGVLLHFRRELVAVTADIEQKFHSFIVKEEDRDFLRFLWFKENDTRKEIIEYRMRVHVFGNSPSPAVAIYGLRRAAAYDEKEYGSDAKYFVEREFYVDDGLLSTPTAAEAIDLLTRTKEMLA